MSDIYEFAEITTDLLKGDHNLTWSYFYFLEHCSDHTW